jgi:hypothetical protein
VACHNIVTFLPTASLQLVGHIIFYLTRKEVRKMNGILGWMGLAVLFSAALTLVLQKPVRKLTDKFVKYLRTDPNRGTKIIFIELLFFVAFVLVFWKDFNVISPVWYLLIAVFVGLVTIFARSRYRK